MATKKNPEELPWEDRVRALEASNQSQADQLAALTDERLKLLGKVEALTAALDAKAEAEAERERQEFAALVADLKTQACAAGSPIPESDLEKVSAAFANGDKSTASILADAFLSRSKALGTGSVRGDNSTTPLAQTGEDPKTQADYAAETARRWARKA